MAEGLTRRESVHAIASVVAEHVHDLFNAKADADDSQAIYNAAVERLTARNWRGGEPALRGDNPPMVLVGGFTPLSGPQAVRFACRARLAA
jgi:hypothetical protein